MPSPLIQMLRTRTNAPKCDADGPARGGCQEGHRSLENSTSTRITISEQVRHR